MPEQRTSEPGTQVSKPIQNEKQGEKRFKKRKKHKGYMGQDKKGIEWI